MNLAVSKGMVKTALGAIGYLICDGELNTAATPRTPIMCSHSSPRSSDEYLEVLPLLAATGRCVVAVDVPGYGMSENPSRSCSVNDVADAFLEVANALGMLDMDNNKIVVVGNLMGDLHAVSMASRHPQRVAACILSNIYFFPGAAKRDDDLMLDQAGGSSSDDSEHKDDERAAAAAPAAAPPTPIPDSFELLDDGSHLSALHNKRKAWLDPELNLRVVQSEINYLVNRRVRYAKGISLQDLRDFDFESPAKAVACPVLCVRGDACLAFFDQIGYEGTKQFETACELLSANNGKAQVERLSGPTSTLNMINQMPDEFAALCTTFLDEHKL